jgi:AcrR family transcriptional regulator
MKRPREMPSAAAAPRRARRNGDAAKSEFRSAIIETAKDLLSHDGYDAVSIRNIAQRVGVTPMAFYRYFESKLEVVQCIWEATFAELLNALVGAMARHNGSRDRLAAFLHAYLDYWVEHVDAARAIFHGDGAYKAALACEVNFTRNPAAQPVLNLWEQVVLSCLPKSPQRAERSRLLRDAMFCQSIGVVYACVLCPAGSRVERQAIRDEWVEMLVQRTQTLWNPPAPPA